MMRLLRTGVLLLMATVLMSGNARADQDSGLYVGGTVGLTRVDSGTTAQDTANQLVGLGFSSASVTVDESSKGFKVFVGYQVNKNFAVEGFYSDLGSFDITGTTTGPTTSFNGDQKVNGMGLDLVGIFPASPAVSIFGKIGIYAWDAEATIRGTGGAIAGRSATAKDDGTDAKFGFGADFKLSSNFRVRTEFEYYNFDTAVTALSVGVLYKF